MLIAHVSKILSKKPKASEFLIVAQQDLKIQKPVSV